MGSEAPPGRGSGGVSTLAKSASGQPGAAQSPAGPPPAVGRKTSVALPLRQPSGASGAPPQPPRPAAGAPPRPQTGAVAAPARPPAAAGAVQRQSTGIARIPPKSTPGSAPQK
jgi:hypothetical protein